MWLLFDWARRTRCGTYCIDHIRETLIIISRERCSFLNGWWSFTATKGSFFMHDFLEQWKASRSACCYWMHPLDEGRHTPKKYWMLNIVLANWFPVSLSCSGPVKIIDRTSSTWGYMKAGQIIVIIPKCQEQILGPHTSVLIKFESVWKKENCPARCSI